MNYSFLITVYKNDNPQYFKMSLESVFMQTIPSNDVVIVCDGPITNDLQLVIDFFRDMGHSEINQIKLDHNVGLGLALNEGLKVCKNELVARMDSDDICFLDRCQKQIKMFEEDPQLDIVGSPVIEFVDNVENVVGYRNVPLTNEQIYKFCRRRDPFNHPTVMYRKSKVLKYGPYGDFRKNQDTDLWIKMLTNGCKCANHFDFLLYFRFDDKTYEKRKSWLNTKLLIQIRKNAWKLKFCSWWDYVVVKYCQLAIYILPLWFQKLVYKKLLRKKK